MQVTLSYTPETWYTIEDGNTLWNWLHRDAIITNICELTYEILMTGKNSERKEDRVSFDKYMSKQLNV